MRKYFSQNKMFTKIKHVTDIELLIRPDIKTKILVLVIISYDLALHNKCTVIFYSTLLIN